MSRTVVSAFGGVSWAFSIFNHRLPSAVNDAHVSKYNDRRLYADEGLDSRR
jgi:hypothetical protein